MGTTSQIQLVDDRDGQDTVGSDSPIMKDENKKKLPAIKKKAKPSRFSTSNSDELERPKKKRGESEIAVAEALPRKTVEPETMEISPMNDNKKVTEEETKQLFSAIAEKVSKLPTFKKAQTILRKSSKFEDILEGQAKFDKSTAPTEKAGPGFLDWKVEVEMRKGEDTQPKKSVQFENIADKFDDGDFELVGAIKQVNELDKGRVIKKGGKAKQTR